MVHRIFKGMVPKTNRKNLDLDLLKRYTTLFAIRHLIDGDIDSRFIKSCIGFKNMQSNFNRLFLNWYIIENKSSKIDEDQDDNVNGKIKNFLYIN
jgi:hypothetical protein